MKDIYPSLLAAPQLDLATTIATLDPYCPGYHLDVMDNHFVPNLTMGPRWVNEIGQNTTRTLWVHLMVEDPGLIINQLTIPPNSMITIHAELPIDHLSVIAQIRARGWRPGIALNPATQVSAIEHLLTPTIDHILIMSVEPGFFGQPFIPSVVPKIGEAQKIREKKQLSFTIGMDGGINEKNIGNLRTAGATFFAVGSALFVGNMVQNLEKLGE